MVDHPRQPKPRARPRQAALPQSAPERAPAPERVSARASDDGAGERVAKALARAGVASRREVERLITEGRVALNGRVLDTPAVKIGPSDILTVNGEAIGAAEATRVWRYHKPNGLLTSHNDPKGRPTVFEHLPEGLPRVISVGRLDLNSEGLLLLTNDGGLARALELPSSGWVRRYRARAYGRVDQAKLDRLQEGVTVEGVAYGPIEAKLDKVQHRSSEGPGGKDLHGPANVWITIGLTEGKNREVRRVLESLGLKVNRLLRLAYGPFALGTLEVGAVEEVGPRVIREQLAEFIAPESLPKGDRTANGPSLASRRPVTPARRSPEASPAPRSGAHRGSDPAVPQRRGPAPPPAPSGGEGEADRKTYKPGWAKPKRKVNPHAPPKPARGTSDRDGAPGRAPPSSVKTDRAPRPPGRSAPSPTSRSRPAAPPRSSGAPRRGPPKGGGRPPRG